MRAPLLRDQLVLRLIGDLVGPLSDHEILTDRPTQRYSTGILYPLNSKIEPEADEDGGLPAEKFEDAPSSSEDAGVSLHAVLKPSSAGLSFAAKPDTPNIHAVMNVEVRCARYERFAINETGQRIDRAPANRSQERWQRVPIKCSLSVELRPGPTNVLLDTYGGNGLELYVLVTPRAGLMTATVALSNKKHRGDSSAYDEEQHFFQVELIVNSIEKGAFAPRPSQRAETDEDSRIAALIYRSVKEYVVGHTCSARAELKENGEVIFLKTEWIPTVEVLSVSDQGDKVFDRLRQHEHRKPLDAQWLAQATPDQLTEGLKVLIEAYQEWIGDQEKKIASLPDELQPQARKQIEQCRRGAERINEGCAAIRDDKNIRIAFQLSQEAMRLQFGWTRGGQALIWRPFQLAFQLLVLASLANRSHTDRDTMDLLWFPTGGGKTEAYLALTAFVILLRRLRRSTNDDGGGVAVLMRYTLRLLTIQQFQRAAAMIFACELLRRRGAASTHGIPNLGTSSIGIGLWVGASATPLTLKDALDRGQGESRPDQLTECPCCGSTLKWKLTPKESIVECNADPIHCELAATGTRMPVWTIDEEVYRHMPSLLIGTIDKFAQIVRKPETGALFGRGTNDAPPDLIIQDELHLISGPLGSIAGLYEVAIDELCRRENARPKIIGSTATIRRAAEQARALFDRDTYQFPAPALDSGNTGFAVSNLRSPGRLYLGITTAGRSATYMLQAISASLLLAAAQLNLKTEEERDYYWTLVVYFNSLRELGRALVLMQDDVPVSIAQLASRRGEPTRNIDTPAELTSRVRSYEIRDMLDRLKKGAGDPQAVDLLLASNMISVGMDIPRLGMMLVNAQPRSLSEYIQATSRVGRGTVPGIIVTMYNNTRARDRSHYETFQTWHRCLYRDVEATSVTPFASRAQDKALHAVLAALVRHTITGMDRRPVLNELRRAEAERIAAVIEQRVARVDPSERVAVSQKLKRLLDEWVSRQDLQSYWDDYERRTSLLMSAEQFAAKADVDADADPEGARRALWPTPNSMREVEPGTPFVLRYVIRTEDAN